MGTHHATFAKEPLSRLLSEAEAGTFAGNTHAASPEQTGLLGLLPPAHMDHGEMIQTAMCTTPCDGQGQGFYIPGCCVARGSMGCATWRLCPLCLNINFFYVLYSSLPNGLNRV